MESFGISIAGVKLWNNLSEEQKQSPSIDRLKENVPKHDIHKT